MRNFYATEKNYKKTIYESMNNKRYFGPYSAVYMAELKLAAGDKATSKTYLTKAKSMNNGEFSIDIDNVLLLLFEQLNNNTFIIIR